MGSDRIEVLPNIKMLGRESTSCNKPQDPDVKRIQEKEEELNVFTGGQPTKEEKTDGDKTKSKTNSSFSWLIIGLALVVIVLIVVIVWYVLKENKETNEEKNKKKLPPGVSQPTNGPPSGMYHPNAPGGPQGHYYRQYVEPGPMGQTEHLPVQTKSMPDTPKTPTKQELENTLNKLSTIREGNEEASEAQERKIKPSKSQKEKEGTIEVIETDNDADSYTDAETENRLSSAFYNDLQQNVDVDDHDDDTEERNPDETD